MNLKMPRKMLALTCTGAALSVVLAGCSATVKAGNPKDEAPPPAEVVPAGSSSLVTVDKPELFKVVTADKFVAAPELNVTGTVSPDVSRNIPVISIATGRVLEIHARLGDTVKEGQLLLKVQSADISGAFSDYRQALADQTLAHAQLERAKILLERGAIAQKDYEVAVNAADKANVTVETTEQHLKVLGADKDHPSPIVDIFAPVSGVITDQQVTQAAAIQGLSAPANPFTISDLAHVWILCDVFENDLHSVKVGEYADVRLNAYPDHVFRARIDFISPTMDASIRTAKVRLEVENTDGLMRFGMFVTATFHGDEKKTWALIPSTAILHLHDRDWVYEPAGGKSFKRFEVTGGDIRPGNMQEVLGINPGDKVVQDALVLDNTVEQ